MQMLESLFGLAGRTALVTGGSRGIGRAACLGLAAAGADVAVHYGSDAAAAAGVVAEIEAAGGRAVAVGADLTQPEAIAPLIDEVAAFAGERGLGVLVNNAGIYPPGTIETLTVEEWDRVFALNARAPFLVTQAALPLLRRAGAARVINIGTVMFHRGAVSSLHYVASKGAVMGLTHSLARALGPDGITVNCLVPSIVERRGDETQPCLLRRRRRRRAVDRGATSSRTISSAPSSGSRPRGSAFTTGQTVMADGGSHFPLMGTGVGMGAA